MAPTFSLIGGTIWGNRGAEAMVCVAAGRVRERFPGARFAHFSYYPEQDARLIRDEGIEVFDGRPGRLLFVDFPVALFTWLVGSVGLRVPDRLLPRSARILRASAALLDVQGIAFDDSRVLYLPYKVLALWPALLLGVPVVKLSQALGPFRHPLNRWAAKRFLPRCRMVFARGRTTAGFLEGLGMPEDRWRPAADLAFSFEDGDSLSREGGALVRTLSSELEAAVAAGGLLVGVSPSSVVYARMRKLRLDYVGLLAELLSHATRSGDAAVVFPNASRNGVSAFRNNDLAVVALLKARVEQNLSAELQSRIFWAQEDLNFESVRALVRRCDVLVASRFHAMVAGLSLGVPTLVVGWSHKYEEVLADFGLGEYAIDYSDATAQVIKKYRDFLCGRARIRQAILDGLPKVKASSISQFDALRELG